MYVNEVKTKTVNIKDENPEILNETASSIHLDGKNLIGVVSAEYAMNLAIDKCKNGGQGISMVALKNGNHFGIAGHYGLMAVEKNLIGMAFTNTSPLVVPTRGSENMLGTNPIAFFASKDDFHLDMATSAVALGKIEMKRRLGQPTPEGWMVDKKGNLSTDPNDFHGLLGLGGYEETSGYKGYGLGAMTDILCGVLAGANYSNQIRRWDQEFVEPANLGQNFICINPEFFNPNYQQDIKNFSDNLRNSRPIEGTDDKVILPGDKARKHAEENSEVIEYQEAVIEQINLQIPEIEPIKIV